MQTWWLVSLEMRVHLNLIKWNFTWKETFAKLNDVYQKSDTNKTRKGFEIVNLLTTKKTEHVSSSNSSKTSRHKFMIILCLLNALNCGPYRKTIAKRILAFINLCVIYCSVCHMQVKNMNTNFNHNYYVYRIRNIKNNNNNNPSNYIFLLHYKKPSRLKSLKWISFQIDVELLISFHVV